ncbi:MAG TPA: mechanosensitive ion channel family protein [Sphingomonas sp.]
MQTRTFLLDAGEWLRTHWLQILIAFAFGVALVLALHALRRFAGRLAERDPQGLGGWISIIGRALVKTGNFFILMLSIRLVVGFAGAPSQVDKTAGFLWTIAAVFQAAVWAREIILGAIEHRTQSAHYAGEALLSAMGLIRVLVTFALFAIALVVVLDNLGVNVTGLVAGLGVGGIAIGLAAQGIFGDLFAALAIIFDRPFRRGDSIAYDQSAGTVEEIGLKSTRIRGNDGEQRVIANKALLDKEIRNNTRRERHHAKFAFGLPYDADPDLLDRVPAMLREVAEAHGGEAARAGLVGFGPSALGFELEFDSPSADFGRFYDLRHAVGLAVLRRLRDEGLAIAYPTQEVRLPGPPRAPLGEKR